MNNSRTMSIKTVLGVFRLFFNENTIKMQTSPRESPLKSDGVDVTGDANQTLVLVAHRTTGHGGQATLRSIQTHSLRRLNSRWVVNAGGRLAMKRTSDEMILRRDNQWDIPWKRALFISDGLDSMTSGSDIPEGHSDRPPDGRIFRDTDIRMTTG